MLSQFDLAVYDHSDELVLVVEVKTKSGTTSEWAARFRRNILAHGLLPSTPYFLIVLPDWMYLWKEADVAIEEIEPTYIIPAWPLLSPYFERANITPDTVSGRSFELIVFSWLSSIVNTEDFVDAVHDLPSPLIESGLYNALAGGRLAHEVVA